MGILSDFEDRVAAGIEGLFAGAFRSPVQPVEIARALARATDDERLIGPGVVYAPDTFTVALSEEDAAKLGSFRDVLSAELSTYVIDHARERQYTLRARPGVVFVTHPDLRLGRFRVSASITASPRPEQAAEVRDDISGPRVNSLAQSARVTIGADGRTVPLTGHELTIGRGNDCAIRLDDANVSRRHAALVRLDDGWAVTDLDSTNGTRVNDREVGRARLRDGDVIEVGLTRLTFHDPEL